VSPTSKELTRPPISGLKHKKVSPTCKIVELASWASNWPIGRNWPIRWYDTWQLANFAKWPIRSYRTLSGRFSVLSSAPSGRFSGCFLVCFQVGFQVGFKALSGRVFRPGFQGGLQGAFLRGAFGEGGFFRVLFRAFRRISRLGG
jgi:hypothetical protein